MLKAIEVTHPYPGLRPFEAHEAEIFFGREEHVDRLLEILKREHFLAVIGPSGCGKSSLVRAGLLPAVASDYLGTGSDWRIVIMRPGDRPMYELARGLVRPEALGPELKSAGMEDSAAARVEADLARGPRGLIDVFRNVSGSAERPNQLNLLVLVDQFEELFTYAKGGDAQADESVAFVNLLLESKAEKSVGIYVVLTMRTDFLGNCVRFLDLPDAINRAQYLTPRLNPDEIKEAIVGPAGLFRKRVSEHLVGQLINSVGGESDQLPILQHALSRIWENTDSASELTENDLSDVGGVADALSKHATDLYEGLSAEQRKLAEHLFRFITERTSPEDGSRDVRRPRSLRDAAKAMEGTEWTDFHPIVEAYAADRVNFLTFTRPLDADKKIDISHEALIRKWGTLQNWVADEAKRAAEYREWRERAMANARGESDLLSGVLLARADRWLQGDKETRWTPSARWAARYTPAGHDVDDEFATTTRFIIRSREEEKKRRDDEVKRQLADAKSKRNRQMAVAFGVLLLFALGSLIVTYRQWRRAEAATKTAQELAAAATQSERDARDSEARAVAAATRASQAEARAVVAADAAREAERQETAARARAENEAQRATSQAIIAMQERNRADAARAEADRSAQLAQEAAKRASDEAHRANDERRTASARLLIFHSEKHEQQRNSDRAQLLAIEAYKAARETPAMNEAMSRLRAIRIGFNEQLVAYRGHTAGLLDAEFSPDGKNIVTAASDGTARLWVTESGESSTPILAAENTEEVSGAFFSPDGTMILTLGDVTQLWDRRGKPIRSFRTTEDESDVPLRGGFSPDGSRIAAVVVAGVVRVWETATGRLVATLGDMPSEEEAINLEGIRSVGFSRDGSRLATVESKGIVRVWDAANGRELMRFQDAAATEVEEEESVEDLLPTAPEPEFSFDGKLILAADRQHAAVWNTATRQRVAKVSHEELITKVHFSPDAKTFVTASTDSFATLWTAESGQPIARLSHGVAVRDATFSSDGKTLVTVSDDGDGRIWDLTRMPAATSPLGETPPPVSTLKGHRNPILSARFSPDGQTIVTASADGTARLWRMRSERSSLVASQVREALWSPDGGSVLVVGTDGRGRLIRSGQSIATFEHKPRVAAAVFSPDGKTIATANTDGLVRLWDANGALQREIRWHQHEDEQIDPKKPEVLTPYVVFSPDNTMLLTTGDFTPRLWNVADGAAIRSFPKNAAKVFSAVFSPNGNMVAAVDANGTAHVYAVSTGEELGAFGDEKDGKQAVTRVMFTPDSSVILSAGRTDGTARLWLPTGAEIREFDHRASVVHSAFSPDGRFIVTTGVDEKARVWDRTTGREVTTLTGHRGAVRFAAFSPDGKAIATTGSDGTVRLWETASGLQLDSLTASRYGPVIRATFAPKDGKQLLTVGNDARALIWDVSDTSQGPDEMIKAIQRRVGRPLTEVERAESHLDPEPVVKAISAK